MIYPKYSHNYGIDDLSYAAKGMFKDYSKDLARLLKKIFGVKYVLFYDSGRAGLSLVLKNLRLKPGSEVAIPVNVCKVVVEAIERNGLKPLIIDIDNNLTMSVADLKKKMTSKTKVVIPVYDFGNVPDMDGIKDAAKANNMAIIEDMAQTFNPKYNGKTCGSNGLCSFISLDVTKHISAFGGGILLTNNKKLYETIKVKKQEGIARDISRIIQIIAFKIATNRLVYSTITKKLVGIMREKSFYEPAFRKLSGSGIALAFSQVMKIKKINKQRRNAANYFIYRLKNKSDIYVNMANEPGFLFLPIGIENKAKALKKIESGIVDLPRPSPLLNRSCNNANKIYRRLILLPTYSKIEKISDNIIKTIENENY